MPSTTPTQRRTARITSAPTAAPTTLPATTATAIAKLPSRTAAKRGYVAIYCSYIDECVETRWHRANKAMYFTGTHGATLDIAPGQEFYLVRAASLGAHMFYIVIVGVTGVKKCSCPANKPCKHEIAVQACERERAAQRIAKAIAPRTAQVVEVPLAVVPVAAKPVVIVDSTLRTVSRDEKMERAPLNGQRGFSLLR